MSEKKIFGREDILSAKRNVIRIDDVPGLEGSVFIREMKLAEFKQWMKNQGSDDTKIVAEVLCDENGALLFNPESEDDLRQLAESLSVKQITHIGFKAISENTANPQAVEKNLQASLSMALSSASPVNSNAHGPN